MPDLDISGISGITQAADETGTVIITPGRLKKLGVPTRDGKGHTALLRAGKKIEISPTRNAALAVSGRLPIGWDAQVRAATGPCRAPLPSQRDGGAE